MDKSAASAWLRAQARLAGPWPAWATAAGAVQAVAIVAQAAVLATLLHGLVMEHRSLAELAGWWWSLPAVVAARALAGWGREEAGQRASTALRRTLRLRLVDQLRRLGPGWRVSQQGGDLASRLVEQVDGLDAYSARYVPQQTLAALVPFVILVVVFPLNWAVGGIFLLTAPLIPLFMALVGWAAKDRQTEQLRQLSRMSAAFLDLIRGLGALRLLGAHRREAEVARSAEEFRRRTMEVLRLAFLSSAVLEFFAAAAIALTAVYLGFHLLGDLSFGTWTGTLDLRTSLFLLFLAPEFYLPLRELGAHYHAKAEAEAAADQLLPLLEAPSPQAEGGRKPAPSHAPTIEFRGVRFGYGEPFLNVDFHLGAGESAAVTGESGGGKTTLVRLLLGHLRPQQGQVLIDGVPLNEYDLDSWREQVSWLGQHPRLHAGTLAENLRAANQAADDAALFEALAFAGLGEWFDTLPRGLETALGEGGRSMSGGELRRLALAGLWLRPSTVLVLDEPTASLDRRTESLLVSRLAELRRGRTTLVLTHREAPLALADRHWQLNGGQLLPGARR